MVLHAVWVKEHDKLPWGDNERDYIRAGGIGPSAPVLAGPVVLKVRIKFCFYKK